MQKLYLTIYTYYETARGRTIIWENNMTLHSLKILAASSISSGQKTKRHFSFGDETDP